MTETVRYTYRLRPGATATSALLEEWGRCRWLWNEAVHQQQFLAKSRMARKAADAAIGACKRELIYLGTRAARLVVLVPPAYTTMTCSECGVRAKHRLGLGIRTFECADCGFTAGRDLNAARTILATAERGRASADDVRHSIASLRDGGSGAVRAGNPPDLSVGTVKSPFLPFVVALGTGRGS